MKDDEPEVEWTETELETTPPVSSLSAQASSSAGMPKVSDVQQMDKMSLPELKQMLAHAERRMSAKKLRLSGIGSHKFWALASQPKGFGKPVWTCLGLSQAQGNLFCFVV